MRNSLFALACRATVAPSPSVHNARAYTLLTKTLLQRSRYIPSTAIAPLHTPALSLRRPAAIPTTGRLLQQLTTTSTPPRQPPRRSLLLTTLYSTLFLAAGFLMAAAPAYPLATGLLTPPTDEETLSLYHPDTPTATTINTHILTHPLALKLRADDSYTEARPHMKIPPVMRALNLTGGALLGPDRIEVPPLVFQDSGSDLPSIVSISYLGPGLSGHPGVVHGGLLATLLDEGLARACFPALPNGVGVTASLKLDFKKPCPVGSYVVLKAKTTKVDGRKAWVEGWIEVLGDGVDEGEKVVEASALFVEPKYAASLPGIYSPTKLKRRKEPEQ